MAQDKYKIFELIDPIEMDGKQAITVVKCMRPKWKHVKRLIENVSNDVESGEADLRSEEEKREAQKQDIDAIDQLICELCSLQTEELAEMDVEDMMAIQNHIEQFTKKFQKTGETS